MAGLLLKELKARGLIRRTLIVTPANLTFQWQREMADKFREKFDIIRGDVLRANYGQNPWQERDQVITSISWVSLVEDARESLLRSRWDLVIVDEAHKMSARSEDHKTYAYRLGESLSKMTDHYLLMTATPHKGDPEHFRRFLALLDADVYGSIQSLEQAMREHEAPFYLRRTKEALVTFPSPDTGEVRKLFTKREVRTAAFDLDGEELDFYDELTRYVEDQSMAAAGDQSARGRAVGFTMALLQRRMASSVYAVRRDGRPLGKLREWGLTLTQIHGGMKIGDRDTPGSRIYAEREFKESAQVLVATEAAGEGINLQFCWLMINFDIPWNPVRLEQRVGRIHRYGQEHDCLVINFVAQNTREGRVLQKLLDRLREIRRELGTDQVFDVVGEVFPGALLEKLFRDMYARLTDEHKIQDRIVKDVSPDRFRAITESALEGLAKKELNLSAIVGKSAEAKERRLVPEVIEQFFVGAAPESGLQARLTTPTSHVYRVGKVPRNLIPIGDRQEGKFGRLERDYGKIAFDKAVLPTDPTLEWVTPGHPLFEVVRTDILARVDDHLRRGAVFLDLHRQRPAVLDVFAASIKDGRGNTLHRRLFVVETPASGEMAALGPPILPHISQAPAAPRPARGL